MERIVRLVVIVLLLTLGISVYAQRKEEPKDKKETPKAKETALAAIKKQRETKGYHFKGKMTMDMGMFKVDTQLTGRHQNPDIEYAKMVVSLEGQKQQEESYTKGKKSFTRDQHGKWWRKQPCPHSSLLEMIEASKGEYLENPKFTGEEKIKEIDCKIIESFISAEGLKKLAPVMVGGPMPPDAEMKSSDSVFKLWVDTKDNLLYKFVFSFKAKPSQPPKKVERGKEEESDEAEKVPPPKTNKIFPTIELTYFDYDKDIEVKFPKEVEKLLEGSEEGE